jgi:hypothetical protein
MKRLFRMSVVAACVVANLGVAGPAAPAAEEGTHSANLKHIKTVKYKGMYGQELPFGTDLEFATINVNGKKRDFALGGTYDNGLQIVDITNPEKSKIASVYDCSVAQGDVQVFNQGKKIYATYAADDIGSNTESTCYKDIGAKKFLETPYGSFIVDITNPYKPKTAGFYQLSAGSHNQSVHPSGKFMYNSNNDIDAEASIEIVDISNVAKPKQIGTLSIAPGLDSHDITFNKKGDRAYSAAVTHSVVIDTSDPAKPTVIGRIFDPAINIHHQADPITLEDPVLGKREFLVVTDELAGAAGNGFCPGGGLHVYDITDQLEAAPIKVGYWNAPQASMAGVGPTGGVSLTCTSHVLRMYPKQKLMTIAWYNAGVRVIDISGLLGVSVGAAPAVGNIGAGMKEIGYYYFPTSDTWSAKTNRIAKDGSFYLFGNDMNRGLDVYKFDPKAAESPNPGSWLNPSEAADLLQDDVRPITKDNSPVCLYPRIKR